jgi:hypothetical protein
MKAKLSNFYRAKGTGTPCYTFHLYNCTDAELEAIKKNKGVNYRSDMEEDKGQVIEVPRVTLWDTHGCKKIGDYATDLVVTENGNIVNGDLETFQLESALQNSPVMQAKVAEAQAVKYLEKKGLLGNKTRQQVSNLPVSSEAKVVSTEKETPDTF